MVKNSCNFFFDYQRHTCDYCGMNDTILVSDITGITDRYAQLHVYVFLWMAHQKIVCLLLSFPRPTLSLFIEPQILGYLSFTWIIDSGTLENCFAFWFCSIDY